MPTSLWLFAVLCVLSSSYELSKSGLFPGRLWRMSSADSQPSAVGGGHGQVFVCTNKYCRDKGSDATMATFTFLTPSTIPVVAVNCLGRCNKGPNVRVLTPQGGFVEATMVRSVEKVVELLQSTLHIDINMTSADVLRLNCE